MKQTILEQGTIECEIEKQIHTNNKKSLLLHACCAPCASSVIEYLKPYFNLTIYFYNPNIMPNKEFELRLDSMKKLMAYHKDIKLIIPNQQESDFLEYISGLENCKEGGNRCTKCFELRLKNTADFIVNSNFKYDFFATTLTVSPHKNFSLINEIGKDISILTNTNYLSSNFKKKNGFLRSIQLSKDYDLYRQTYCGCKFD